MSEKVAQTPEELVNEITGKCQQIVEDVIWTDMVKATAIVRRFLAAYREQSGVRDGWKLACRLHSLGYLNSRWIGDKRERDELKRSVAKEIEQFASGRDVAEQEQNKAGETISHPSLRNEPLTITPKAGVEVEPGMDFWWEKFCEDEGHDKAAYQPPAVICEFGKWFANHCAEAGEQYFGKRAGWQAARATRTNSE